MVRGATYEIEVTIKNDAGTVIDLTTADGILVGAYNDGKRVFAKWSLVAKDGYDNVVVTDAVNGVITVALQTTESLKSLEKNSRLEVVVSFPNPLFDGNTQISIDTNIELEIVESSIFEGITPNA
jgi:hypothetical protein